MLNCSFELGVDCCTTKKWPVKAWSHLRTMLVAVADGPSYVEQTGFSDSRLTLAGVVPMLTVRLTKRNPL